jgi:serine/threonine protein kinase
MELPVRDDLQLAQPEKAMHPVLAWPGNKLAKKERPTDGNHKRPGDRHSGTEMDRIVGRYYRVRRRIGAGSFGDIHNGEDVRNHRCLALKFEQFRARVPQLLYESKLYTLFAGGTGIRKLQWFGADETHSIMVTDLLGKSLEDIAVNCHRRFSVKTVLMLADQMISCIEFIHSKNFIHRDVKPDNFVIGLGEHSNQVFIIDFGLSKKYREPRTHMHIPYVEGKSLTGTAR